MADTKLTALSAVTPSLDDLVYVVDDVAGTPTSKKATVAALLAQGHNLTYTAGAADAGQTMAVNTLYYVDISGYAADRTYTLPGTAAVGDVCAIVLTAGDTAFELLITAGSGDTLNGIAGGTEWSRLFITGEAVYMMCVAANAAWIVVGDGRIPCQCLMRLSTDAASSESAATATIPTAISGVWTADTDIGGVASTSDSRIYTRRAGNYLAWCRGTAVVAVADGNYFLCTLYKTGTANLINTSVGYSPASLALQTIASAQLTPMAATDYFQYMFTSQAGSRGLDSSTAPRVLSGFGYLEVL